MIRNLFPSLIHLIEIPSFKEVQNDIVKYVYDTKKQFPEGYVHSNVGGWQSHKSHHLDGNILNTTICNGLSDYFAKNRIFKENIKLQFESMWININTKGNYNGLHVHPGCDLAGVLWIKIPKGSGKFCFNSPFYHSGFSESRCYTEEFAEDMCTSSDYYFIPQEGVIMLFPSTLYHEVKPNESNQDRISSSFNINLIP